MKVCGVLVCYDLYGVCFMNLSIWCVSGYGFLLQVGMIVGQKYYNYNILRYYKFLCIFKDMWRDLYVYCIDFQVCFFGVLQEYFEYLNSQVFDR